ncbi:hypothetical protein [Hyalangium rubrum]|uniref:Secreted protein n=1 Tax=Hyalangium rubrum TaxID=3103134 RepID=A0ABU5GZ15_9BACT|nr:hypothetical protein [Hyalangium sp. s54d21]MDY7226301.1 hypothetical protein [Hyalangium sp. s54d21]
MLRKTAKLLVGAVLLVGAPALAGDQYHVYKTGRGECEIDTRDHEKMKSARGSDTKCLEHDDYRMDAEKIRKEKVKAGACKCPSGNNC